MGSGLLDNVLLLLACYAYILLVILVAARSRSFLGTSAKFSRKFLHVMIGNLPFIIPFFSLTKFPSDFPFFVAAPFVVLTFLATPRSPLRQVSARMGGLGGITEQGHQFGLVFYAISYSVLALLFAGRPYIIAAGILPMAYGDASASLVGERYGKHHFKLWAEKSVEGSVAMFIVALLAMMVALFYFSIFYPISPSSLILAIVCSSAVAAAAEAVTPLGFDNVTVPLLAAFCFLVLSGGL